MDTQLWNYRAQSVRVVDGDTIDLVVDLGFYTRIEDRFRLFGINAFEMNSQAQGERERALAAKLHIESRLAAANMSALAARNAWPLRITTQKDKKDKYGRMLCILFVPDGAGGWCNLNQELVDRALAVPYMV